jgi:4-amino-4-deoxy-L-arabinose transferase-like glycosyltransferase
MKSNLSDKNGQYKVLTHPFVTVGEEYPVSSSVTDPGHSILRRQFSAQSVLYGWPGAVLVCVGLVVAVLPNLHRLEFFDGVEHFTLATVQEMKRDGGNWLIPTLEGEPRTVKPPLTAWLAGALVSPEDVAALSMRNAAARDAAFDRFVFRARLPTLFCAAIMLLGVYQFGRAVVDARVGLLSTLACASCLLFLFQGRRATTDLQLAVWVTWTNALIATAIFQKRYRLGLIGGGVALGLAMMAKGPHVALLQTVVPLLVFLGIERFYCRSEKSDRTWLVPAVIGLIIAVAIGLGWYAFVLAKVPGVWDTWMREMFRKNVQTGRNVMKPDKWNEYSVIFGQLLPWTGFVIFGAVLAVRDESRRLLLPLLLLVLPILVMSFFAEKKTRYLIPFVGPAAVLAGAALVRFAEDEADRVPGVNRITLGRIAAYVTMNAAGWFAVCVPIAGAIGLKEFRTWDGRPWFTPGAAAAIAIGSLVLLLAGTALLKRSAFIWIVSIVLATWIGSEIRLRGDYLRPGDADDRPQRVLAAKIWQTYPAATIYTADPPTMYGQLNRAAIVVSIHTNRVITSRPDTLPSQRTDHPLILISDSIAAVPPVPAGWKRWQELPLRVGKRYVDVLE